MSSVKSMQFRKESGGKKQQSYRLSSENSDHSSSEQGNPTYQVQSWSEDQVKDELSSFIAEFSYLADGNAQNKVSEKKMPNLSLQTYEMYPAHINKNTNFNQVLKKNLSRPSKPYRKTVEWKDESKARSRSQNLDQTENYYFISKGHTRSDKEIRHEKSPTKSKYEMNNKYYNIQERPLRNESRSQSRRRVLKTKPKSRSARNQSRHKSRSQSRRRVIRRKRLPRSHSGRKTRSNSRIDVMTKKRHRSRVGRREYPHDPHKCKRRSRSTRSLLKYMPLRYERKISKRVIRRPARYIVSAIKTDVKLPVKSPSIITLYPSVPSKRQELVCPYNQEFLTDSHVACKCYKCMKKYQSLMRIMPCNQQPPVTKLKAQCRHVVRQDWCCGDRRGLQDLAAVCCSQAQIEYHNSVHFKFNSVCQHVDSKITQYFHSILDKAVCSY